MKTFIKEQKQSPLIKGIFILWSLKSLKPDIKYFKMISDKTSTKDVKFSMPKTTVLMEYRWLDTW